MKLPYLVFLSVAIVSVQPVFSQGCSDAGVCTLHSIRNNTASADEGSPGNELALGYSFGKGERSISYPTWEIEYTRRINASNQVTARLGYSLIVGELARTSGLTDLFLSLTHSLPKKGNWQKSWIAGFKLPFDEADIEENGIHLPMPYQTSLGSFDFVAGFNLMRNRFGSTLAIQQPIRATNGNQFLPENYSSVPLALRYLPSNRFTRKGDLLLRFSYQLPVDERLSFRPSLLAIYHLGNDSYVDLNKLTRSIARSSGLTANANLFLNYHPGKKGEWELSLGTPFVVRTNRPDGLTRSFVGALNYRIHF